MNNNYIRLNYNYIKVINKFVVYNVRWCGSRLFKNNTTHILPFIVMSWIDNNLIKYVLLNLFHN